MLSMATALGSAFTHRPDALLLDAGDTLVFFDGDAVAAALAGEGISAAPARLEAALHPAKRHYQKQLAHGVSHIDGWSMLMQELLVLAGIDRERALRALPALKAAHLDFNFWRRVPDGLPEALGRARSLGLRLGVVSNSEGRLAALLERVGLASHFEVVVDSQLEGVQKPGAEIFVRALERMGVSAARAVYAGDIPEVDVLGARAAGISGVLVDPAGRYPSEPGMSSVRSVRALIDALLALPLA
jgi:HAD superfamily hydrolase (TIGR01509 family)